MDPATAPQVNANCNHQLHGPPPREGPTRTLRAGQGNKTGGGWGGGGVGNWTVVEGGGGDGDNVYVTGCCSQWMHDDDEPLIIFLIQLSHK